MAPRTAGAVRFLALACSTALISGCLGGGPNDRTRDAQEIVDGTVLLGLDWTKHGSSTSYAMRWKINVLADTECRYAYGAAGRSSDLEPNLAFLIERDGQEPWFQATRGQNAGQIDAQVAIAGSMVHDLRDSEYDWAFGNEGALALIAGEEVGFTFAAREVFVPEGGLPDWAPSMLDGQAARFRLDCPEVAMATVEEGDLSLIFDEQSFQGAAHIGAFGLLDPTSLTVQSRLGSRLDSGDPCLVVEIDGDLAATHGSVGLIEIDHPSGSTTLVDIPRSLILEDITGGGLLPSQKGLFVCEGPGVYDVQATWSSVSALGRLQGAIFVFGPDP